MKKASVLIKDNQFIFLGFLIPFIVMIFICVTMQITPFGAYSFLVSDLSEVYMDSLTALKRILTENESLFNTWSQIQGSTPLGMLSTGILVNLFSFLVFIFPKELILDALTWMIILKIACCGITCAFYLKKTFQRNDLSISIFAWCYALMAYTITYHFHIIWLDQVVMLPLVLYGVDKIIKNKKDYLFFTICLTVIFFMNYYIAYMTGIFSFMYFIYRYITLNTSIEKKDFLQKMLAFFISPLFAFGCASILLFPILYLASNRGGIFDVSQLGVYLRYDFKALWSKTFVGVYDTVVSDGTPLIYCGTIVIVLMIFFFLSYSISYREKLISFIWLVFMFLSMTLNPLYMAWHGFEWPTYFEGRFTYTVSFLMIFLAYKGFRVLNTISTKQIHCVFGILGGIIIGLNFKEYSYIQDENILLTLLFLFLYYLLLMLVKNKVTYKKYGLLLLALLVGLELADNSRMILTRFDSSSGYPFAADYYETYNRINKETHEVLKEDQDFYHIERVEQRSLNDGFGMGYPGISHFDTMYNEKSKNTIANLGISAGDNWTAYKGTTPITEAIFNIKYVLALKEKYFGYELLSDREENYFKVFENPYVIGAGFAVAKDIEAFDELGVYKTPIQPFEQQNELLSKMLGEENKEYLKPLKVVLEKFNNVDKVDEQKDNYTIQHFYQKDTYQKGTINYSVVTEQVGPCYLYVQSDAYFWTDIVVNGKSLNITRTGTTSITYLGDYEKGEKLNIQIELKEKYSDIVQLLVCNVDDALLKKDILKLRQGKLNVEEYTDERIKGSITIPKDKPLLYTSIPYDRGWHLFVDGQSTPTKEVIGGFLGADLKEGKHEIELIYKPVGFKFGMFISIISVLCLVFITIKHRQDRKL